MNYRPVAIPEFKPFYYVYEDGSVYSLRKERFLKPQLNSCGYVLYHLTQDKPYKGKKTKIFSAHRLVLISFEGYSTDKKKKEVNHIDGNKLNNHLSNLEWVTHSENILKSFETGRRHSYWLNKTKPPHSLETRIKMSNAKKKRVVVTHNVTMKRRIFESIGDTAKYFKVDPKTIQRYLKQESWHKTYYFRLQEDFK